MPQKESRVPSGPMSLFKKRSSLHGHSLKSRSSSWSVGEWFRSCPVEEFMIEELGNKSGHLVYGPVSVFNGKVSMNVKSRLLNVTISVTFRGLTEYAGRKLAFLNFTENMWTGDLEPGTKDFLFALRFPPVNLPPTSIEPYIEYNFVAQIKPGSRASTEIPSTPMFSEQKTYTSKPYPLTFIPYVDPFAKSRFDIPDEPIVRRFPAEAMPTPFTVQPPPAMGKGTGGRPMLKLTTDNLPPSPSLRPVQPKIKEPTPPKNPGVEKSAVIFDPHNRMLGKLKVVTEKSKFVPGDELKMTLILTLPKGTPVPKQFSTKIVERRTLGFEEDEDADQVVEGSDEGDKPGKTSSGKIFSRTLTSRRYPLSNVTKPTPVDNRPMTASSNLTGLESYTLENGIEVTETFTVRIPTFKTFIDEVFLPSASLPLGPAYKDFTLSSTVPSTPNRNNSVKGKEPMRPNTPHRPHTATTVNSVKSVSVVHGLQYIVAHSLIVQVPLTSGIMRMSSGTLAVDLPIILGNKTPDVYSYNSVNGSMEVLKVSTPELVVIPPGESEAHDLLGSGLGHQESRASFERRPSPLRNMGGFDGAAEGSGGASVAGRAGDGYYGGHTRTHSRPVSLRAASSRVSFRSLDPPEMQWKKGEKFPTLSDSKDRPTFWIS